EALNYDAENERGVFLDNYTYLPASVKGDCTPGHTWGLFLLDEKVLMVGSYDSSNGRLTNCWLAPFQLMADTSQEVTGFIGRRADEPPAPITMRQVHIIEATEETLINLLIYGSGTPGYNHGTYDVLGFGLGLGMPGELYGFDFERTVGNLPRANAPAAIILDEPKSLGDIIRDDLRIRWSFFRWKDQHFEMAQWKTPVAELAIGTLTEANKAAPAGMDDDHRVASRETDEFQKGTAKIDYSRDYAVSRNEQYQRSVSVEDQTAVDDSGGGIGSVAMKMRNTYAQMQNTGAAIEGLLPDFISMFAVMARPLSQIARSIDPRFYEGPSVGDVFLVNDKFARDPITGTRGIGSRPAMVTRHWYSWGGPSPTSDEPRPADGGVELMFLDLQRGSKYSPAAEVDETANSGGFTAGYNSGTATLRCKPHAYSHVITITTKRGFIEIAEGLDASNFDVNEIVDIVQIDPDDPATAITWSNRTITVRSGNDITINPALSSPSFDSTKLYRITSAKYSQAAATQKDDVYQGDDADEMIEDVEFPYQFSATEEAYDYNGNTGTEKGELVAAAAYGDGRPWDVGHDRALINLENAFIDGLSAHQAPFLWSEFADDVGSAADWYTLWMGPFFFGTEHLTTAVYRLLTLAPWMRSSSGGTTGYIRATLSRVVPIGSPGTSGTVTDKGRFTSAFAQAEWSTSSATWGEQPAQTLELSVKDLFWGFAWLVIEKKGTGQLRGFSRFVEGARRIR
ncbi:MAG TPA: hypothetical protein VFV99_32315, partial [Kofleriaceae bacterium]|nr:hypothetical protein [Kofleriaceae bacterium]